MSKSKYIVNQINIRATALKVWDALTNPNQTKIYMYGCETVSDWKVGSSLVWRMNHEGKELIVVKGFILEIETSKKLVYTVFDPNSSMMDVPENYLTVKYELIEAEDMTQLLVSQGDYNLVAEGERRFQEAFNHGEGWNPILVQIKTLVESN